MKMMVMLQKLLLMTPLGLNYEARCSLLINLHSVSGMAMGIPHEVGRPHAQIDSYLQTHTAPSSTSYKALFYTTLEWPVALI